MVFCGHRKHETYESEKRGGFWSECHVCGVHTALFESAELALAALKRMRRIRPPKDPVGPGRPRTLPVDIKLYSFQLCPAHVEQLDRYKTQNKLQSRAQALRHLLENRVA